jgi:hypothetical protein
MAAEVGREHRSGQRLWPPPPALPVRIGRYWVGELVNSSRQFCPLAVDRVFEVANCKARGSNELKGALDPPSTHDQKQQQKQQQQQQRTERLNNKGAGSSSGLDLFLLYMYIYMQVSIRPRPHRSVACHAPHHPVPSPPLPNPLFCAATGIGISSCCGLPCACMDLPHVVWGRGPGRPARRGPGCPSGVRRGVVQPPRGRPAAQRAVLLLLLLPAAAAEGSDRLLKRPALRATPQCIYSV